MRLEKKLDQLKPTLPDGKRFLGAFKRALARSRRAGTESEAEDTFIREVHHDR